MTCPVSETIADIRARVARSRADGLSVALVPTMGALHAGHESLIRAARERCGFVVVSIFVNPTQFGPGEDYASYPRSPEADLEACARGGAAVAFMPQPADMYDPPSLTVVSVPSLSGTLCGARRPGHFEGVCTVVAKLFNIVQPDLAFFGAKDYQQATILRRMAGDLNFPLEVVVCPTVRETDGLAMSSRNRYLSGGQRAQALALHESLLLAGRLAGQGERSARRIVQAMREHLARRAPDGQIDYIQIVDPDSLADVDTIDRPVQVLLAVRLGRARLIDNMRVDAARPDR